MTALDAATAALREHFITYADTTTWRCACGTSGTKGDSRLRHCAEEILAAANLAVGPTIGYAVVFKEPGLQHPYINARIFNTPEAADAIKTTADEQKKIVALVEVQQ